MNRFNLVIVLLLMLFSVVSASSVFLPNTASIGYPYYFNVTLTGADKQLSCILKADDKFSTNVKVWGTDGNDFPLVTGRDGFLHSFVLIDNAFVVGENYTFSARCGSFTQTANVFIDVGGSSVVNIFFLNALEYVNARPDESTLMGIVAIGGIVLLGFVAYIILRKRGGPFG